MKPGEVWKTYKYGIISYLRREQKKLEAFYHAQGFSDATWEALCKRCGECCKYLERCPHLSDQNTCQRYSARLGLPTSRNMVCYPIHLCHVGKDCPYRPWIAKMKKEEA